DGEVLRRQLSHDQEPAQSHRRLVVVRRSRARPGPGAGIEDRAALAARTRRDQRAGRPYPSRTASRGEIMSDETRRVLDLLAQNKITVDEADQLLRAMKEPRADASSAKTDGDGPSRARYIRIAVHKLS